ncbi:uncharacterized protein LOC107021372 [Solanum pennellii]|uniref:Uncharacterized protein LOC107021372 n=1 Tax=Solanum pennellii TaxID=28526 RepID=A0ABM1GXW9_SOLPN|nr:uncharacterized protein LOC107021372 [Solanum pennellii]
MGVSTTENAELAAYQLKDVAQTWYSQSMDSRALGGGLVTLEIFKKAFLDRFFPRDQREDKVELFINFRLGGMSVKRYSLKFIKLTIYASSLVSNASRYVTGMSEEIEEECRAAMLHDNMDISRLTVHSKHVQESRLRKRYKEARKARSFESSSFKSRLDVQDKPKFKVFKPSLLKFLQELQ